MLGQASAIKVRNQVSEYPPLSKLAGCFMNKKTKQLLDLLLPVTKNVGEQREFERQVMQYADQACYESALRDPIARIPRA